jgi:hypothetical protein
MKLSLCPSDIAKPSGCFTFQVYTKYLFAKPAVLYKSHKSIMLKNKTVELLVIYMLALCHFLLLRPNLRPLGPQNRFHSHTNKKKSPCSSVYTNVQFFSRQKTKRQIFMK